MKDVEHTDTCPRWETPAPHVRQMGLMFDPDYNDTAAISAGLVDIPVGEEQTKLSVHEGEEIYMILDGEGTFTIGGESMTAQTGQAVLMPADIPHAVDAESRFKMLLTMLKPAAETS